MTDKKIDNLNSKLQHIPIAVIGVASIFPDSTNVQEFWDNIMNEVDSITDVPPSRWKIDDYYDSDPKTPDKSYSKRGGFIPDIDFNPMEFGLPPNILEVTDVSQLLALIVAKNVLKDAGYGDESNYDRSNIGVTLGVGGGQKLITPLTSRLQYPIWKRVLTNSGVSDKDADIIVEKIKKAYIPWEENSFPGMLGNVIAGRVANRLNLGGTNCVLDAACASSLTAIKMAISDLLEYRSEIMISGGVDTDNSPFMYLCFSKTPAFSPGNKSKPFDVQSKGMLVGEGVGMVALKRLDDAERDNDRIYALVKGLGTSSDGKFKSIYAPRPDGQAKALKQAYEIAGFSPKTVGLIEAHGTGTVAGDNAEFIALNSVFGSDNLKKQYIALGSVKSQIGHTKAAAGSAGFIKASLSLYHNILPATINVDTPHPKMDIENTPFYINSETRPWFSSENNYPRRAGVSSFGFGGTNFHIALEEYSKKPKGKYRKHTAPYSIILTGAHTENLMRKCKQTLKELDSDNNEKAFYQLLINNKVSPLKSSDARLGFVCKSLSDARELLKIAISTLESKKQETSWNHPKGIFFQNKGAETSGKIVGLFSGQGSQYLNMGKTLAINFPPVMDCFDQMNKIFVDDDASPLTHLVFPIPKFTEKDIKADQEELKKTENVQPSIGTFSAGLYTLLKNAGFKPDFLAGHSFGELTALWAAGVLNDQDYFFLARERGKAMAPPDDDNFDAGAMSAVMGDVKNIEPEIKDFPNVIIANHNSNIQVVIAGPTTDILKANERLKSKGFTVVPLAVSAAFHTSPVEHAQKPFAEAIRKKTFHSPKCKVYSNTSASLYPENPEDIQRILENHILNSVRFKEEIEQIYSDGGRIFVEFGPKKVLTKLVSNILENRPHLAIALNSSPQKCSDFQLRQAVVQLCVAGVPLEDIDTYREIQEPEDKKHGKMKIRLNGTNYVSDKTKKAYEDALNDGHQIKQAKPEVITKVVEVPVQKAVEKIKKKPDRPSISTDHNKQVKKANNTFVEKEKKGESHMNKYHDVRNESINHHVLLDQVEQSIGQFFNHQGEILKVHSQQIDNAREYTKSFYDLMGKQFDLFKEKPDLQMPESIERSMEMFHHHQGETLKVHSQYLENQTKNSTAALEFMKQKYGVDVDITPQYSTPAISVSEPVHLIEQKDKAQKITYTEPPKIQKQEPLTEPVRTEKTEPVQQNKSIAQDIQQKIETPEPVHQSSPQPDIKKTATEQAKPETITVSETIAESKEAEPSNANAKHMTESMLAIVAEKTGYPTEMLELEMDMEADLGIDSIKRVEILAAFKEQFPDIPEVTPEELTPLKTLEQIVNKFTMEIAVTKLPDKRSPESSPKDEPTSSSEVNTSTSAIDIEKVNTIMLSVVAEKTGYPTEMLELDMDMEADLGIDSIKRVEILAAIKDQCSELPDINPDELAPLKTLGQIVDKFTSSMPEKEKPQEMPTAHAETEMTKKMPSPAPEASSVESSINIEKLTNIMLSTVAEKTGYPTEMLELDMDMEADLGIDSIKRVEILAGVKDQFPELPEINPDELSSLKTLEEVVNKMAESSGKITQITEISQNVSSITESKKEITKRSIVKIHPLPRPDYLEFDMYENEICLITDDGTKLTSSLCKKMNEKGWKPLVLIVPDIQSDLPEEIERIYLKDLTEETLKATLRQIENDFAPIGGFIHLDPGPSLKSNNAIVFPEKEKDILLHVFLMAKHLKSELVSNRPGKRRFFMTISRIDGTFGLSGETSHLISGGLFGLTKTLSHEWPTVFCRAVDIDPKMDSDLAMSAIISEIHDPDTRIKETAYGSLGRITLISEEKKLTDNKKIQIDNSSVFLITGGAKGVTAKCIEQMASKYPCTYILLGRSKYPETDEPTWAQNIVDEAELKKVIMEQLKAEGHKPTPKSINEILKPLLSDRDIRNTLRIIRKNGATAEYISADVTNEDNLSKSLAPVSEKFGPITGIIHGAGVLADKLIENKTIDDFNAVYSTKINGLKALIGCVDCSKLTHLALFSSAAGFYGNEAQADYTVANEIFNKVAYRFKHLYPNCHVSSFNWGPWDGGMVTPELKRMFEEKGIDVIPVSAGTELFTEEMLSMDDTLQVLVGSSMVPRPDFNDNILRSYQISRTLLPEENPFLNDHVIGNNPVLPTVCATWWMADTCEKLYPGFRFFSCSDYRLYKGIVFDKTQSFDYVMDIKETNKDSQGSVTFDVKIMSPKSNANFINHYGATIKLVNKTPEIPIYKNFDKNETHIKKGKELYIDNTLFHGPIFQAIERVININQHKLTMECRMPEIS